MASVPFKVKAIYEYSSVHEDDLNFPNGQIITVTAEEDDEWYIGEYDDTSGSSKKGLFPKNFVEKYEPPVPTRPSRPARPKVESTPAAVASPTEEPAEEVHSPLEEPQPSKAQVRSPSELSPRSPPIITAKPQAESTIEPSAAPKVAPAVSATKAPPPAVAEKPSSFRDRIAAFNKGSAPPIAPKPQGAPSATSFIKKPYVAPPPSKNAYIPPPKEPVAQKIYRREEDPEIAERRIQDAEAAEAAGLAGPGPGPSTEEPGEDAPKPQSLKDRIALLQKQQAEQAMRRAEVSQKEKPKKPHKKPSEPRESQEEIAVEQSNEPSEDLSRASADLTRETTRRSIDRRASKGPKSPDSAIQQRELFSDGNDADQSAAGETTEDAEGTSGVEDIDDRIEPTIPASQSHAPVAPKQEVSVGDEGDSTEEEEEQDEVDVETRRKLELRERMAKMSGGMGMAGMFGAPMPMPSSAPKKKKSTASSKEAQEVEGASSLSHQSQAAPMVPVPGMQRTLSPKQETEVAPLEVSRVEEEAHPITSQHGPDEIPDVEDIKPEVPSRRSTDRRSTDRVPPSIPQGKYFHPPLMDLVNRSTAETRDMQGSTVPPTRSTLDYDGFYDRVFVVRVCRTWCRSI